MKKLPDADVVFTAVLFGRVTVTFGMIKSVSLNWVVVYEGTETGAVLFSVLFSLAVATFSIAKTSKAPELYKIKVRSGHHEEQNTNYYICKL